LVEIVKLWADNYLRLVTAEANPLFHKALRLLKVLDWDSFIAFNNRLKISLGGAKPCRKKTDRDNSF
jgi:hypothetical protein